VREREFLWQIAKDVTDDCNILQMGEERSFTNTQSERAEIIGMKNCD
jgi:hypothetical protein